MEVAPNRRTARQREELVYFTRKPCPKGHIAIRYTSNGACSDCLGTKAYTGQDFSIAKSAPKICKRGHTYNSKQCPVCLKAWHKLDCKAKRAEYTRRHLEKRHQLKRWLDTYKETHSCTDCHRYFPHYQMEFDHVEPRRGNLTGMVSRAVNTASLKAVIRAIAPCDLVCALCHAARTHFRCGKCLSCEQVIATRNKELPQIIERIEREYALR